MCFPSNWTALYETSLYYLAECIQMCYCNIINRL